MARVSIFYDEDLKEQFFMVRGDERYARATKTVLEVGASTSNLYDFDLSVTVNVLRDDGDGTIVIYDNNSPVFIIDDWNSSDNARTIVLEQLAYDIDHILTAEYRGNNKCSPSLSSPTTVNIHDTNRVTSTLTISSGTQQKPNTTLTGTLTLTNSASNPLYNQDQEIDIYYDGTYISTVTTLEEGTADFTIPTGDNGLHTIKAEYVGSEHLTGASPTRYTSVGYKIYATAYDKLLINGVDNHFTARVMDFFDNPIYNTETHLVTEGGSSITDPVNTDINGYANFIGFNDTSRYIKFYTVIDSIQYNSELYPITNYTPTSVNISSEEPQMYKSEDNLLSVIVEGSISEGSEMPSNIPIRITGDLEETIYTDEVYYQSNAPLNKRVRGIAHKTVIGTGKGDKSYLAEVGNISSQTLQVPDYLQFWQPNNNHNKKSYGANFMNLNNLYRIEIRNPVQPSLFALPMRENVDYSLVINGLTTSRNAGVCFMPKVNADDEGINIHDASFSFNIEAHSNETWSITRRSGTVRVYKNNTLINTHQNQETYQPAILYAADSLPSGADVTTGSTTYTSTYFDFTKLTLREL